MKQLTMKSKIIITVITLIIIAGIAVVAFKGFSFELKNQDAKMIEVYLGKQFLVSNVDEIATEVLGTKEFVIQKVEAYEDSFELTAREITEEQKSTFVQKINEKYGLELKAEDITIQNVPHEHLKDIIKPYIVPLVIATVIILAYIGIRYIKLGIVKSILKTCITLLMAELTLFSIMAISRFPIGRYTLPLTLFVYLVTMLGITINLEKNLKEKKLSEEEQ